MPVCQRDRSVASGCQRDRSVASAYQTALKKKDDIAIALALSPFARKTAELVNIGAYEAAAGSCYIIFRCLAKTCKEHENWFCGFTGYGDIYTKLAIFTEAVVELYCHLRQKSDLSKRMADEMDINLEVFNLETDFFGDLHCSSRFTDMLCDAQAQYGDYSELEKCPMWGDVDEGRWRGVMKLCSKLGRIKDVIMKCDMIQRWENSRIIIWSVCIVYVLSITLLMAYVYMLYGVVAPFAVLFVSMALLQPYKIAYEYYSTRRKLDLSLAIRITNCWTIYQILNMTLFTGGLFAY